MAKSKAQQALAFVREQVRHCESVTDLHNAFFGNGGRCGQLFPTREKRSAFFKSPEYEEIVEIRDAMEEPGRVAAVRSKAKEAMRIVRLLARSSDSPRDFHNSFFGIGGEYGKLFPTREERMIFRFSPEYEQIGKTQDSLNGRKRRSSAKR
jgi:hypothetical protein